MEFKIREKKLITVFFLLGVFVLLGNEACHKPGLNKPDLPPVNSPGPRLPATLYNYSNLEGNIPTYLLNYIRSDAAIDNTPANNPITDAGATLGRVLFYDKQLSVNNKISCASCHRQEQAFTDGKAFSTGFENGLTRRNAMSLTNLRYFKAKKMFWDLRADNLEAQVLMPIQDHVEMGMPSLAALTDKLNSISYYKPLFQAAFGSPEISSDRIAKALSQFLRSIISFNSKYDQGLADNFAHFTAEELHGKAMVIRAFCTECHSDLTHVASNTNPSFLIVENSGLNVGNGSNNALEEVYTDPGIGSITNRPQDQGTFKIPSLRNIELTAPYMHDGRFTTLEQVIDHYSSGIKNNPNRGIQLFSPGFTFTDQEKHDIIAFLKTLTDHSVTTDPKYSDPFQ